MLYKLRMSHGRGLYAFFDDNDFSIIIEDIDGNREYCRQPTLAETREIIDIIDLLTCPEGMTRMDSDRYLYGIFTDHDGVIRCEYHPNQPAMYEERIAAFGSFLIKDPECRCHLPAYS